MTEIALATDELRARPPGEEASSRRVWLALSAAGLVHGIALAMLVSILHRLWPTGGWLFRASLLLPLLSVLGVGTVLLSPLRRRLIAAMALKPAAEHSQLLVRTIFGSVVACWVFGAAWIEPAGAVLPLVTAVNLMFPLCLIFLFDLLRHPGQSTARQRLGVLFDGATTSIFLALGGDIAAVWWPAYLWTIFGQGMRFGARALVETTLVNVACFAMVLAVSPYWQERPIFSASIIVTLAAVPAYTVILVSRLHAAIASADAANRTKSRFLAFITHELRSPLNAIIGFSEMLRDEALGPIGAPRYKEWAADINNSGRHLLALINDLLDISKLEAGRLSLAEEEVDLGELAASSLRFVAPEADKKRITLTLDVRAAGGLSLRADALRLRQVLINLLANAVKFSDPASAVKVEVVDLAPKGFLITVSDSGAGMRPEDIPLALQPYGQVDASLRRRHEGTGLGLPLTKALVEKHGGSLEIESALGRGTTVRIRLPEARRLWLHGSTVRRG